MAEQSTGICKQQDTGCTLRSGGTIDSEWKPARSGSTRQFITEEQAANICNQYVDAFFAPTGQTQHQQNANMKNIVEDLLSGCVKDLVLTGQIEVCNIE